MKIMMVIRKCLLGWLIWTILSSFSYLEASFCLVDFAVSTTSSQQMLLMWDTANEIQIIGFHLWRKERNFGKYEKINQQLIETKGAIGHYADYYFIDETALPGLVYLYQLEAVDRLGISDFYGPYEGTVSLNKGQEADDTSSGGCFLEAVKQ